MLYSEKLKIFSAAHPSKYITVDGAQYRYVLGGQEDGKTLVFLNGGMNTLEMWMDYVDALAGDHRVLLFDYPQELPTNQALVTGMHAFFKALGIEAPIFVGASDGGMVAQIYVQKYPGEAGGMILISTGGMDEATLKSLKKKYRLAPVMLWYMKHCNYEKLKPTLIKAGMRHVRDESADEVAYAQDMFETIFKDYALKTYNKDVGEKAAEYVAQGVTYDQYYAAYFAARGITGDKDENGKPITNSASRKKKEAIDKAVPDASTKQKHLLYEALGVSEKVW